jgi:L-fuconate dehydratase
MPCYFTTWIGSQPAALVDQIASVIADKGIRHFKVKVGLDIDSDIARLAALRSHFGDTIELYTDANQIWSPPQAVKWMERLAAHRIRWIEEPTAPDSIDGHRFVRERLGPLGIDVVTGENCQNSHVAAQFIAAGAVDRFQIDACRVLGPAENMLIMLVAKKYGVPICPHAGGSGLDELVPHLSAWNAIALGGGVPEAITEHVSLCSRHFVSPSVVRDGHLRLPVDAGYIVGMKEQALAQYRYPHGRAWN